MYEVFEYLFPYLIFNTNLQGKEVTEYFNLEEEVGQCMWPGLIDREWWVHCYKSGILPPEPGILSIRKSFGGWEEFCDEV